MVQLVRNTLTNKEGFMIFILWNHLWMAGLIAYSTGVEFWKLTSVGLLITLIVSPLYFIRKKQPYHSIFSGCWIHVLCDNL